MKKKKIIATILIIIAIGLLVAGGIIIYQNYSNKNRIVTSFKELQSALKDTFNIESTKNKNDTKTKETAAGVIQMKINPILGNSNDGSNTIINNINNSTFNYEYRIDEDAKKMYLNGSLLLNMQELMGINLYQNENISYIFLKNIFDKYIMIDGNNIFNYLEETEKTKEDINYIYDKISKSLGNNITKDDIKVANEKINKVNTKKISLELNEKRFNELATNIINDLKEDEKVKEILGTDLNNLNINDSNTTYSKTTLAYNIYIDKNDIIKYEIKVNEEDTNYGFAFNNGKEKSIIIINDDDNEIIKGTINNSNNNITINLTSNNTNLGTINITENNININFIIDEISNTSLNASVDSITENNKITTNINMSMNSSGTNIDILTLTDIKTITEGVADFANINTTNNININNLTDGDITLIENNLMTILYNYLGINI